MNSPFLPSVASFGLPGSLLVGVLFLLSACASVQDSADTAAPGTPTSAAAPELTLNLPVRDACPCPPSLADRNLLERGYRALAEGDRDQALDYFQRYRRLESAATAQWEADMAIAFLALLPGQGARDPAALAATLERLERRRQPDMALHPMALLMRDALAVVVELEQQRTALAADKVELQEELARREEAIKRLRELTLGQSRGSPP